MVLTGLFLFATEQGDIQIVDGKRQVRDCLHDLQHAALRVEAHPLDPVRARLKAADMNHQVLAKCRSSPRAEEWGCRGGGTATRVSQWPEDLRDVVACQSYLVTASFVVTHLYLILT